MQPDELLHSLTRFEDEAFELIICDGPDAHGGEAARIFGLIDEIVAIDETPGDEGSQSQRQALAGAGVVARTLVCYDAARPQQRMRA